MLDDIAAQISDHSAQGIAAAINRLVTAERLTPGDRLPTCLLYTSDAADE